jgi:hypothetical protein
MRGAQNPLPILMTLPTGKRQRAMDAVSEALQRAIADVDVEMARWEVSEKAPGAAQRLATAEHAARFSAAYRSGDPRQQRCDCRLVRCVLITLLLNACRAHACSEIHTATTGELPSAALEASVLEASRGR